MRAHEFIKESSSKLRKSVRAEIPRMRKHNGLDNSGPYDPWRFSIALAGMPDYPMPHDGPVGQKLVTVSYSKADQEIIDATEKLMGASGEDITTPGSQESDTVNKKSPVANWMKPSKKKKK